MKFNDIFLLLVVLIVVLPDDIKLDIPSANASSYNFSELENEGMVAIQVNKNVEDVSIVLNDDTIVPNSLCKCDGTKKVTNELGLKINCPCGESCKCKSSTGISPVAVEKIPVYQMYEFTVKSGWCKFCNEFTGDPNDKIESSAEQLKRLGWGADEKNSSLIRVYDIEKDTEIYEKFKTDPKTGEDSGFPFFVMTVNGVEVERMSGSIPPKQLSKLTDMFYRHYKE